MTQGRSEWAGRRVVITGGGGGIGTATAWAFAAQGASLLLADTDADRLCAVVRDLQDEGVTVVGFQGDVSVDTQVQRLIEEAQRRLGGLDVLVNNAGIQRIDLVQDATTEDWDLLMAVNAKAPFLAIREALPLLRESRGVVVNVSSLDGLKGGRGNSAYSASKGAVVAFTKAIAIELAEYGIRCNVLCPGWIDNRFNEPTARFLGRAAMNELIKAEVPMRRPGTNEEAASAILFLSSQASAYMTGQSLVVDGGVL